MREGHDDVEHDGLRLRRRTKKEREAFCAGYRQAMAFVKGRALGKGRCECVRAELKDLAECLEAMEPKEP